MLIILFGLSGSGKNFVGEILAEHFNYHFLDADTALPQDMRNAIEKKESFTQAMRDNFTHIIIKNVSELQAKHENIVIAQAFYKETNRDQIRRAFPNSKLIYIKADQSHIIERLKKRNDTIDVEYANKISRNFEEPSSFLQDVIENNEDKEAVIEKLKSFFEHYSLETNSGIRSKR